MWMGGNLRNFPGTSMNPAIGYRLGCAVSDTEVPQASQRGLCIGRSAACSLLAITTIGPLCYTSTNSHKTPKNAKRSAVLLRRWRFCQAMRSITTMKHLMLIAVSGSVPNLDEARECRFQEESPNIIWRPSAVLPSNFFKGWDRVKFRVTVR